MGLPQAGCKGGRDANIHLNTFNIGYPCELLFPPPAKKHKNKKTQKTNNQKKQPQNTNQNQLTLNKQMLFERHLVSQKHFLLGLLSDNRWIT